MTKKNQKGGRPPKFNEPRRPITVTLPVRTLEALSCINPDRARAIVKLGEMAASGANGNSGIELVEIMPGKAMIIVGPSQALQKISWLRMAEVAPLRYLLIIPSGKAIEALEIEIRDLIDSWDRGASDEREMLEKIRAIIGNSRRTNSLTRAELIFVDV